MESEKGRLKAKLGFLLEHSREHVKEFQELAKRAEQLSEAAIHHDIQQGIEQVSKANQHFEAAFKKLK